MLVSNVGQTVVGSLGLESNDAAQSFTTGTNAAGYTLTSIELSLETSTSNATPTVNLYSGSANGTEVSTFTGPATLGGGANAVNYTFTPSSTVTLGMSTTYWVVAEGDTSWVWTTSTSEDGTSATGWGIGDNQESRSASSTSSFTVNTAGFPLQIRVNGTTVGGTNAAPTVANPIDDQTATVGVAFSFTFLATTFADTDAGATLTYTATQSDDSVLPSWLSFDAATRTFSGTPTAADVETVSVKVTASDGTDSVSDTFDIVVSAAVVGSANALVSNIGQVASGVGSLGSDDLAQPFTTGTNATGYTLTSIELKLNSNQSTDTPTVKLYRGSANGTEVATFTGPSMLDASGTNDYTFTPASTVTVLMSTTYWVVAEANTGNARWAGTVTSEDATPATGWSIGDVAERRNASSTGSFGTDFGAIYKIRVNGTLGGIVISSDATLSALALEDASDDSAITISPTFASGTTSYTASVDNGVDKITIKPTVNESSATVEYLNSSDTEIADADSVKAGQQVSLSVSANTIKVKVTAEDTTTTNTYTVVVTRAAAVPGTVTVSESALTVTEENTTGDTYTVVLGTQPTADVTVTVAGHSGTDVTPTPASLTFTMANWSTAQTVTVKAGNDADLMNDTVTLTHSAASTDTNYSGITIGSVVVTVTDNDTARVTDVAITSSPDSGDTYGTGERIQFTVTFDHAVTVTGTPEFEFCLGSSATVSCSVGTPPPARRSAALLSGSGTTALVFSYTVLVGDVDDNGIYAGNQTIKLDSGDAIQGTVGGLTAVLTHDEVGRPDGHKVNGVARGVTVSKSALTVTEQNTTGNTYTVVLDTRPTADVMVTVFVPGGTDVTLTSLAFTSSTPSSGTLTFTRAIGTRNWNVAQTVTVKAGNDTDLTDDTVTLTHSAASSDTNYNGITIGSVEVTVEDNDTAQVTGVAVTSGNAGLLVNWVAVDNATGYKVQWKSGTESYDTTRQATITSGSTISHTIPNLTNGTEYTVRVTATRTGANDGPPSAEATGTPGAAGVTVSESALTVTEENATGGTYTVVLNTQPTASVTVTVAGHAGTDVTLTPSSGTLTFTTTNWSTAQTVTVTADTDTDTTNDTVTLTHSAASTDTNYSGITIGSVTVTVTDNDTAQVTGVMVASGNARLVVNWVAVDNATGYKVQWKSGSQGYNTGNRQFTVDSGTTMNHTITGLTNGTEYTVRVTATRTGANDGPSSDEEMGTPAVPTTAGVTVSTMALMVTEENTTGDTYTVVLNTQPTADVTVTVAGHSGTDVTPTPASLTFTTTNWSTAQTVTVKADTDTDTTNDTVTLTHSATSTDTNYGGITIANVVVTVADNDTAQVTGVTVTSGNARLVVSWMAVGNATGYKVQWKSGSQSYNTGTRRATITSGTTTSHTITGLTNGTEYTVRVTATRTGANDGLPSAEVMEMPTLLVAPGVTVSESALTVTEENATGDTYTVVLNTQPTANVTVTVSGHTGTDVTPAPASLTFTSVTWSTVRTVRVTAGNDADMANDTVTLAHSATSTDPGYNGIMIAGVVVTVTDNDVVRPPPPPPPTNTPPVVANPLADQEATTGASFTYVIPAAAFTDADGTTLAYTATLSDGGRLPSWLTFDPATRTFTGTPGPGDGGTVRVTVMASDGTVTVSDEFVLMVTVRNTAPVVANPLADQEVMIDVPFTYVVPADAFTDADGDPLAYTAATRDGGLLPGWLTFDPATQTFTGTPASSDSGPVFVTVTASDGTATVSDEFAVRVLMVAPSTLRAWTSRFGRTVATHVTDAVGERLRASPEQDSQVTVGGYRLPLGRQAAGGGGPDATEPDATDSETATAPKTATDRLASLLTGLVGRALGLGPVQPQGGGTGTDLWAAPLAADPRLGPSQTLQLPAVRLRDVLLGSSFRLTLGDDAAAPGHLRLTAWGRVAGTQFDGREGDLTLDGNVLTGTVGVDSAWDRWLAGVAVSHSLGGGSFTGDGDGDLDRSTLTSIHPYLRYAVNERVDVWSVLGYGWGDMTLEPGTGGTLETDTTLLMGSFGGRGILLSAPDNAGFQLATRTDAMLTRTTSGAVAGLAETEADAHRLRLVLEGTRPVLWLEGQSVTPTVELGVRHDWGDAETGFGLELGGRVQYADPTLGLTIEAAVRGLLTHEDSDYKEWGASGTIRLAPDLNGQGLSLTLAPTWGAASSGIESLWSRQTTAGLAPQGTRPRPTTSLNAEMGYGVTAPFGTGLLTPYAGALLSDGTAHSYRLGTRWTAVSGLSLTLEGLRQESPGQQPVNQGLHLQIGWGF